ncbi:hypothetical protein [Hydrogenophaga sp.]|uniref:hypothetical protein n=1 Tax=Hydrogenophaga sp. TaxID=1904254 RepID=UPI003AF5BEDE
MIALKTFAALSTLALLAACAGPRGSHGMAAMEHMHSTPAMQAMHDKVKNAKTPEERQALMAEHMKAMDCGMTAPPVR